MFGRRLDIATEWHPKQTSSRVCPRLKVAVQAKRSRAVSKAVPPNFELPTPPQEAQLTPPRSEARALTLGDTLRARDHPGLCSMHPSDTGLIIGQQSLRVAIHSSFFVLSGTGTLPRPCLRFESGTLPCPRFPSGARGLLPGPVRDQAPRALVDHVLACARRSDAVRPVGTVLSAA